MTVVRKRKIGLLDTQYYHCISSCVCSAFLCGEDNHTGKNFEHSRACVEY